MISTRKIAIIFAQFVAIFLSFLFGTNAAPQLPIPASISVLPANAKDEFDRGMAAAQQQSWELAIRYFTEAHLKAPAYPPLLFNLSLVHAQAGHEAAAAGWLKAYLAAVPDASNAAAAREKLVQLEVSLEQKIIKILEAARQAAQDLTDEFPRKAALFSVAIRYAQLGDINTAVSLLPEQEPQLWLEYANAMIDQGDLDHALNAVAKLAEADRDRFLLRAIAVLERGDDKTRLDQLQNDIRDPDYVAKRSFDQALAQDNVNDANAFLTKVQNVSLRNEMTFDLVRYHIAKGNLTAAKEAAQKSTEKLWFLQQIAVAHLKEGNVSAAQTVAKEAKQMSTAGRVLPVALSAILDDQDAFTKMEHITFNFERLIYVQALMGKLDAAQRTQNGAERELKNAKLSEWKKYRIGRAEMSEAIAARVRALSAQGKYTEARKLASELAKLECSRSATLAFIALGRLALTQNKSEEVPGIVNNIPSNTGEAPLQDNCVTARATILLELVRSHVASNRTEDAKKIINQVNDLVWRGALDKRVLQSLTDLQSQTGDEAGAATTQIAIRYVALPKLVLLARYLSEMRTTAKLVEEIQRVTSGADKNQIDRSDVINVPAKLASITDELIWALRINRQRSDETDPTPDRLASWVADNRGNELSVQGLNLPAIAEFTEALRLDPQNAGAYFDRANSYLNLQIPDRAFSDYSATIRIEPNYAGAYANRGALWAGFGLLDVAIHDFTQAIKADPNLAEAYKNRGTALKLKRELDRAIADLNEAVRLNPKFADAYVERCNVYNRKNDLDRAMQDCEQAIRLDPNNASAFNSRGLVFHHKNQLDRAIQDYDQAIRLNPRLARVYNDRGVAWQAKGPAYNSKAIADYQKAIELNPNDDTAKQNLARLGGAIPSAQSTSSEKSGKSEAPPPATPAGPISISGKWAWQAKCEDGTEWTGEFDFAQKSDGTISGNCRTISGMGSCGDLSGRVVGNKATFSVRWLDIFGGHMNPYDLTIAAGGQSMRGTEKGQSSGTCTYQARRM